MHIFKYINKHKTYNNFKSEVIHNNKLKFIFTLYDIYDITNEMINVDMHYPSATLRLLIALTHLLGQRMRYCYLKALNIHRLEIRYNNPCWTYYVWQ